MKFFYREWQRIRESPLAHNVSWMFLGQGLSLLSQVLDFILLARRHGPTEYGIYAGVFAMTAVL